MRRSEIRENKLIRNHEPKQNGFPRVPRVISRKNETLNVGMWTDDVTQRWLQEVDFLNVRLSNCLKFLFFDCVFERILSDLVREMSNPGIVEHWVESDWARNAVTMGRHPQPRGEVWLCVVG